MTPVDTFAGTIEESEGEVIEITSKVFPDKILRHWVQSDVDTDKDGSLDQTEINNVREVTNAGSFFEGSYEYYTLPDNIKDLTGLEIFSNVNCIIFDINKNGNEYNYIDISNLNLSSFTNLQVLYLRDEHNSQQWSSITDIDISNNKKLRSLRLEGLGITELNLSGFNKISELDISHSKIEKIDLSSLTNLQYFWADDTKLESIEALNIASSKIQNFYIGGQIKDTYIDISNWSNLTCLSISGGSEIEEIRGLENCTLLQSLYCLGTKIESLDLSNQKNLEDLVFEGNNLSTITNIKSCKYLKYIRLSSPKIESIDVSGLKRLENLMIYDDEEIKSNIKTICAKDCNNLKYVNFWHNDNLEEIDISNTKIHNVLLGDKTSLKSIYCSNCNFYAFEVPSSTNVIGLKDNHIIDYNELDFANDNMDIDSSKVTNTNGFDPTGYYQLKNIENDIGYDYLYNGKDTIHVSILLLGHGGDIVISKEMFPDDSFRQYISESFDINNDGKLSVDERLAVTRIHSTDELGKKVIDNMTSTKGIECFPNVDSCYFDHANINSIDLSKNLELEYLSLREIRTPKLILPENSMLKSLTIGQTNIKEINLDDCEWLKTVNIHSTPLKHLDLSKCENLTNLYYTGSLFSLELPKNFKSKYASYTSWYTLKIKPGTTSFNLEDIDPKINPDKITLMSDNAEINGTVISGLDDREIITYKYDTGNDACLNVNIRINYEYDNYIETGWRNERYRDSAIYLYDGLNIELLKGDALINGRRLSFAFTSDTNLTKENKYSYKYSPNKFWGIPFENQFERIFKLGTELIGKNIATYIATYIQTPDSSKKSITDLKVTTASETDLVKIKVKAEDNNKFKAAWNSLFTYLDVTTKGKNDSKIHIEKDTKVYNANELWSATSTFDIDPSAQDKGSKTISEIQKSSKLETNKSGSSVKVYIAKGSFIQIGKNKIEAKNNIEIELSNNSEQLKALKNRLRKLRWAMHPENPRNKDVDYSRVLNRAARSLFRTEDIIVAGMMSGDASLSLSILSNDSGSQGGGGTGGGFVGGGGGAAPAPTTPEAIVKAGNSITKDLSDLTKTSKNSEGKREAITTIDSKIVNKIVSLAEKNNAGEIVLDVVSNVTTPDVTVVSMPKDLFNSVGKLEQGTISIQTDSGEVKMDAETVKAISEFAGTNNVELSIEKTGNDESAKFEIILKSGENEIHSFNGGLVSITVDVPKNLKNKPIQTIYTDSDGNVGPVSGLLNKDGTFTFKTNHLSEYQVIASEEADKMMQNTVKKLLSKEKLTATSKKLGKHKVKIMKKKNKKIDALNALGYEVKYKFYRSSKSASGYKLLKEKATSTFTTTKGTKNKKYYYKFKVSVYDLEGNRIYQTPLKNCKAANFKFA